jgi:hypothetical protein
MVMNSYERTSTKELYSRMRRVTVSGSWTHTNYVPLTRGTELKKDIPSVLFNIN